MTFSNKVALITGGGGGIGRATSLAFAKEGAKVVVADIDETEGEKTASLIRSSQGEALFVKTDVSKDTDVRALINAAVEKFGRLDFAHNNAGVEGKRGSLIEYSESDWDKVISVNLKGVFLCMKYAIPEMIKIGKGAIVNTASITGIISFSNFPAYTASKHAVIGLTRAAARSYAKKGIRVNSVCPGMIDTEMIDRGILGGDGEKKIPPFLEGAVKSFGRKMLEKKQVSGRAGLPEEVAKAVLWLCSEEASYVNGHQLVIDGGFIA